MVLIKHPLGAASTLTIEPLAPAHDRAAFVCLDQSLTDYITGGKCLKDVAENNASVYSCVDEENKVLGFFTLSSGGISRESVARALYGNNWQARKKRDIHDIYRKFPYDMIGVTVLGRLAIHSSLKGHNFGPAFIAHALRIAAENSAIVSSKMVFLQAKNERVEAIYQQMGFINIPETERQMFMQMDTIKQALLRS